MLKQPMIEKLEGMRLLGMAEALKAREGMGWKRWSREWLYDRVGLFHDYRRVRPQQFPKANPMPNVR